ncbi:hypothetical protein A2U01_0074789, partial [Trifolium medium]|nr:hypothetical protein [Trifolium medium]
NIPAADKGVNVVQSSSSQTAPATASGTAPSLWDPLFNPMAFIEKELHMVDDVSSFAATSTEELRQLSSRQEQEA